MIFSCFVVSFTELLVSGKYFMGSSVWVVENTWSLYAHKYEFFYSVLTKPRKRNTKYDKKRREDIKLTEEESSVGDKSEFGESRKSGGFSLPQ